MDTQRTIDNHYIACQSKMLAKSVDAEDIAKKQMERLEQKLIEDNSDLALDYLTSPIDSRYQLTTMSRMEYCCNS